MASTSTGKLTSGVLEFQAVCDQCQRPRVVGNHIKCSKIRQQIHAARNELQSLTRSRPGGGK
ncbi:hypothetical protein RY26_25270 [Pseudomonas fluorescens]|nr:hypothetical protein RY26_25270 [Pseudomonas fluorescens]